jgi:hypothetical protein
MVKREMFMVKQGSKGVKRELSDSQQLDISGNPTLKSPTP